MLTLEIKPGELFNESTNEFITTKAGKFRLEHSLISISKWESTFQKPLINSMSTNNVTMNELRAYIGCMIIGPYEPSIIDILWNQHADQIKNYIESPQTATIIRRPEAGKSPGGREIVTSELIYYWMIAFNIPYVYERWHINRLLTLIDVCNIKNSKDKKLNKRDIIQRNRELNAKRREALNSKG